MKKKILEIKDLKVHFKLRGRPFKTGKMIHAVDGVNFEVFEGETLGIVGESGSGKSSLARALCGLNHITSGSVIFDGRIDLAKATAKQWNEVHKHLQFVFQDPVAALNPRMTIAEIIAEPLITLYPRMAKASVIEKVRSMIQLVGLDPNQLNRYPQEFSGGQCQRINIARALILEPGILICDESVSALDASIKAQIINLLQEIQQKLKFTILFISHDLGVIRYISDRVLVMYLGQVVEIGPKQSIYASPQHPYTQALLSAVPVIKFTKKRVSDVDLSC
jgi:oligopeptide transport system ATP-binding protein